MEHQIFTVEYESFWGTLILGEYEGEICLCDWKYRNQRARIDKRLCDYFNAHFVENDTALLQQLREQLEDYSKGTVKSMHFPLRMAGSDFQKAVWKELLTIPYGKCISYLDLATRLGNPGAIRAVAAANGANAISVLIPCHRVIGSDGELTGYAGGLQAKRNLLKLEGYFDTHQYSLFEA